MNAADGDQAERLHAELVRRTGVQEAAPADADRGGESGNGEQPGRERPPDAREAVDRDSADRIVDAEPLDERHRHHRDGRRDEADQDRGPRRDEAARSCDSHERREDPVEHHRDVGLAEDEPRDADPADSARGGSEIRRQCHVAEEADVAACRRLRASSPG